ncbi:histidine phosphatase family protein [archaeon]|jgi:broad specificity phosphatase PhoE|nr:histidine phosphatase family protein [archaeon]MBT3451558.1 histidine phosphatase family protein [archaeon]MBT6869417.1 histidine phosphatase family protein [archaeon]MBT7192580.1 histidine phosphatase family protein [archaeon]MBT7380656.1 histidine phosphatase family protein [archaeon]
MKLIIVRHGETFENTKGISQGHMNSQLTLKGIEQAKNVAKRLKGIKIDIAYSSDLDRSLNTCKEILKYHDNIKIIKTQILREQSKGIFEGRTHKERNELFKNDKKPFHLWHPENGERLIDVWNNVNHLIEKIKQNYNDKNVLIVSHGGPIACILTHLHKKKIEEFGKYLPENTAISVININNDNINFKIINCNKHLD